MDLFGSAETQSKTFSDYAKEGNKKGAIDYLRKLNQDDFFNEVVLAGYSMIGFHHGKPAVLEHVVRQL